MFSNKFVSDPDASSVWNDVSLGPVQTEDMLGT